MNVLELSQIVKEYPLRRRKKCKTKRMLQAIKPLNMTVNKGECVGLVGESGSGKSTVAKLVMQIEPLTSGKILLHGKDITENQMKELEIYKRIQLVMQDSASSLHPKMCVKEVLEEPIKNYFSKQKINSQEKLIDLLHLVGLNRSFLSRYPHQLSGGQKQRVCIAKALAVKPELIIFDESIASLDKTSQSSMINMLKHIKQKEQLSYLFITHDLESTKTLCDRVCVMYKGEIVETFSEWDIQHIKHPYTHALLQTLH